MSLYRLKFSSKCCPHVFTEAEHPLPDTMLEAAGASVVTFDQDLCCTCQISAWLDGLSCKLIRFRGKFGS